MSNPTLRLFFALWPGPPTRAALAALAQAVAAETGGRVTAADNVHLTLAFLGAQPCDSVKDLVARARAITATAFVLTLDHIDCWRKNGVAWAGASEIPAALALLRQTLVDSLAEAGIADDPRPFAVHVTLARKIATPLRRRLLPPIDWSVDGLALIASEPDRDGPAYRVLESVPFNGPR